ncbi:MAG: 3-phosphoserine/phosphohydroxythreonine transaminase [Heliobacteriaceae bacterium]|nr:3-phosphoserine/phosphohydroxythreonine transaminase [Heliobacteriaceae bacterium]MDD4588036.1 3-phosphoserine/phosphohydroxythreonine transaminase [Heliobacteriaceae bacterium]
MANRVFNFNPGPAALPLPVLAEAQRDLLAYDGTGMSIMEMSHRSAPFQAINAETEALTKELLGLNDDYRVLFLQGGASTQFAMVPLNFLGRDQTADYLITGSFSEKAHKEAQLIGKTHIAADTTTTGHNRIPPTDEINFSPNPAYIHLTSNNTICGTQWHEFPTDGDIPLVADMSSDILSRPFAVNKFALIYAGAQKNLGPAGVTVVIIRQDLLEKASTNLPSMLRYDIHAKNDSLYNTPPCFAIYMVNLVLKWVKNQGGLPAIARHNAEKAALIYEVIDNSGGFYRGHAVPDSRSLMNITFRLPGEDLEKAFVREATAAGLVGLKGHRSVGGLRASIYNAMSREGCVALAGFMREFQQKNG